MSISGRKQHFSNLKFSVFEPFYHLFTSKLGNLGCLGRPEAAKKVINSHQNIIKVAKTPYFIFYPGFSPGSICRFCLKVVQMCSFACPSTSRNQFGCLISAGLRPKKTALCHCTRQMTNTIPSGGRMWIPSSLLAKRMDWRTSSRESVSTWRRECSGLAKTLLQNEEKDSYFSCPTFRF